MRTGQCDKQWPPRISLCRGWSVNSDLPLNIMLKWKDSSQISWLVWDFLANQRPRFPLSTSRQDQILCPAMAATLGSNLRPSHYKSRLQFWVVVRGEKWVPGRLSRQGWKWQKQGDIARCLTNVIFEMPLRIVKLTDRACFLPSFPTDERLLSTAQSPSLL